MTWVMGWMLAACVPEVALRVPSPLLLGTTVLLRDLEDPCVRDGASISKSPTIRIYIVCSTVYIHIRIVEDFCRDKLISTLPFVCLIHHYNCTHNTQWNIINYLSSGVTERLRNSYLYIES